MRTRSQKRKPGRGTGLGGVRVVIGYRAAVFAAWRGRGAKDIISYSREGIQQKSRFMSVFRLDRGQGWLWLQRLLRQGRVLQTGVPIVLQKVE